VTIPAAETKSIGLLAFALLSWFLHRHLDNFIMTKSFSSVYQIRQTGSGQFLPPGQVNLSPGLAKIALPINRDRLWCLARRDKFQAKAPGLKVGVTAPPTLTAPTRCR